ncbi:MAG TPA: beta-ketoacyl-ACP synthase, partial [Hyphomonadaceae bacterium]|nr:beta-ketoacyl-ACP synthase [Hyphomonadaceae bacterium]
GHLLGAAGAVEAAFTALAVKNSMIPPTLNLENPSFESEIDLTPLKSKSREIKYALSNSFGFGGTNAALVLGRVDD